MNECHEEPTLRKEADKDKSKHRKESIRHPRMNKQILDMTRKVEEFLRESIEPYKMSGLNGFQRKQIYSHFEKTNEFKVKAYREQNQVIIKVYPIGNLRRLAEQKVQEVLMNGKIQALPRMGSYERFVIHDYLKDREGIRTGSIGESGKDRHIQIYPLFGRNLKKAKKKLIP